MTPSPSITSALTNSNSISNSTAPTTLTNAVDSLLLPVAPGISNVTVALRPPPLIPAVLISTLPTTPLAALAPAALLASSVPGWPSNWVNAWIPLETWGQFSGFGKPVSLTTNLRAPNPGFQFNTPEGPLTIKVGSRIAWFAGSELWLGYEPRLVGGSPYLHSLDAQKTFRPLLTRLPPAEAVGRTIVLDPGHGGKDGGTHSSINLELEKQYTLDWALRLSRLLEADGWRVVMTRTNDVDVPLAERVRKAEQANADLFVSLHFNSGAGNHEMNGIETYCLPPAGMPSSLLRGYEDDLRSWHPNNAFDEQNLRLAYRVHRIIVADSGAEDRGVRRARFMGVLRGQHRPAVLIEGGYLTNIREARRISTPSYRQALAEAVARALQ